MATPNPLRPNDKTALTARLMESTGSIDKTRQALRELGTSKIDTEAYLQPHLAPAKRANGKPTVYMPTATRPRPTKRTTQQPEVLPQSRTGAFLAGAVHGFKKAYKPPPAPKRRSK